MTQSIEVAGKEWLALFHKAHQAEQEAREAAALCARGTRPWDADIERANDLRRTADEQTALANDFVRKYFGLS